ncbi:MAG: GNAT family N-acetyltransferase [Ponticaulis sp.]|nr:GNAT family N-acetyltransferase [Ponticaulis sp.]|tara:strand:- start:2311 stop:2751 length:441 start_codon:yes stop_codon:yes gene_type:complete
MSVEIRPVTQADRPVWGELWTGYLTFYRSELPTSVYDTTFSRFFDDGPYEPRCRMAWKGKEAVGLVHFLRHRHCWRPEDVIYLQDLYVSEAVRGTGAGRALIEAVYAEADALGCSTVYWTTADNNHTARQLYDRVATKTEFIKYQR